MSNEFAHQAASTSGKITPTSLQVLIVEDSPVTQDVLKEMLKAAGHKVHVAGDGKSALKAMLAEPFDVVLIDYYMPNMDGCEVIREYQQQAPREEWPVFGAITADPAAILSDKDHRKIVDTVFAKPFDFDDVLSFVESVKNDRLPPKQEPAVTAEELPEEEADQMLLDQEKLARQLAALMPDLSDGTDEEANASRQTATNEPVSTSESSIPTATVQATPAEPEVIDTQEELAAHLASLMPKALKSSEPTSRTENAPASDDKPTASIDETASQETSDEQIKASRPKFEKAVLIAEDSPVTQDILKLLLSSAGYEVDVAQDGSEALKMIKARNYFLALMDYNMPGHNGAEVIKHCLNDPAAQPLPIFAAMTAEPAAVLSDEYGEKFRKIFAKPFNFDEVLAYIDQCADTAFGDHPHTSDHDALLVDNAAASGPDTSAIDLKDYTAEVRKGLHAYGLDIPVLRWPEDVGPAGFSVAARQYMGAGSDFDAVVISEKATAHDLRHLWSLGDLYLLPIVDETGQLGSKADVSIPSLPRGVVNRILESTLREFKEARQSVHIEVRQSKDLAEKLAASTYVRNRVLSPEYSSTSRLGFTYNCSLEDDDALAAIVSLSEQKLVDRKFFDRFHVCNSCRSVRLNVREECFECRSPNLTETTLVHHFRCAYQGPLQDFQQGADLVCPKCSRELRHFGVDYDKPGIVISCNSCGASASDAAVGFQCLDCGQHTDGEMIQTSDVFEYSLTEKGIAFVEEGPIVVGGGQKQLKFAELPLELVIELNKSAREFTETSRPFCLMNVGYPDRRALTSEHGFRMVEVSRSQMVENLQNYFGDQAITHQGTDYDYILINRLAAENCRANLETYNEVAMSGLKINLAPRIAAFGPEELFG